MNCISKKICLMVLLSNLLFLSYSQNKRIDIVVGIAFRGVPVNLVSRGDRYHFYHFEYIGDQQFECTSLSLDVSHKLFGTSFYLQLSNYIRYNYFRELNMTAFNTSVGSITERRLKTDHLLDIQYKINLDKKNNWKLKVGVGYGIMNTGTGFTYPKTEDTLNAQGNLVYNFRDDTFLFWAPRFTLGASFKKYNV